MSLMVQHTFHMCPCSYLQIHKIKPSVTDSLADVRVRLSPLMLYGRCIHLSFVKPMVCGLCRWCMILGPIAAATKHIVLLAIDVPASSLYTKR